MEIRRMAVGWLLAAGLVLGACSDSDQSDVPTATVPVAPPTTVAPDPFAVPAIIDEAYVNRVLAALDAPIGDVLRLVVEERSVTPEAIEQLKAIYVNPELLALSIRSFEEDLRTGFAGYRLPPGDRTTTVKRLLSGRPDCLFVEVQRDYSTVATEPVEARSEWIAMRPQSRSINVTGWGLIYDGFTPDLDAPSDPCIDS